MDGCTRHEKLKLLVYRKLLKANPTHTDTRVCSHAMLACARSTARVHTCAHARGHTEHRSEARRGLNTARQHPALGRSCARTRVASVHQRVFELKSGGGETKSGPLRLCLKDVETAINVTCKEGRLEGCRLKSLAWLAAATPSPLWHMLLLGLTTALCPCRCRWPRSSASSQT